MRSPERRLTISLLANHSLDREACRWQIGSAVICGEAHAVVAAACGNSSVVAQVVDGHSLAALGLAAVPEIKIFAV